jgi:peroxiredoxin
VQLGQLQRIQPQLIELGYQIIAISPDRPEKLRDTVEGRSLKYQVVSDSSMEAAKALGIAFQVSDATIERYTRWNIDLEAASGQTHHLLPVPAVFLISTEGIIQFQFVHPNYRVRLDPEILLAVARSGSVTKLMKE